MEAATTAKGAFRLDQRGRQHNNDTNWLLHIQSLHGACTDDGARPAWPNVAFGVTDTEHTPALLRFLGISEVKKSEIHTTTIEGKLT